MPSYRVRVFAEATGRVTEQFVTASSSEEATRQASTAGTTILELKPIRLAGFMSSGRRSPRIDLGLVCSELSALLRAGLNVVECLDALAARGEHGTAPLYRDIAAELREGRSLSQALEIRKDVFPGVLTASVRSAERTGKIADALEQYGQLFQSMRDIRRKLISTAVYPAVVVSFGFVVALFLLLVVIPRFATVYTGLGPHPGLASQVLLNLSQVLQHYRPLFVGGLVAIVGSTWGYMRYRGGMQAMLRLVMRVALFKRWIRLFQMAEFFRALAVLLRGGFSVVEALQLCAETPSDASLRDALDAVQRNVGEGRALSDALHGQNIADEVALRLVAAGERSGDLPTALNTIADDHARRVQRSIEQGMRLAEPLAMIAVGLFVGALVMLMYMPIFDLAGTLQ